MQKKTHGNNIKLKCFKKRYIIGIKNNVKLVFLMLFVYFSSFIGWVLSLYSFYHHYLFISGSLLFIVIIWYYLICFLTEPGIIPRRSQTFSFIALKTEGNNYQQQINNKSIEELEVKRTQSNQISLEGIEGNYTNNNTPFNNSIFNNNDKKKIVINIFPGGEDYVKEADTHTEQMNEEDLEKKPKKKDMSDIHNNSLIFVQEEVNNTTIPSILQHKPCVTCEITRPPKASHCRICDNCIMNMDQ